MFIIDGGGCLLAICTGLITAIQFYSIGRLRVSSLFFNVIKYWKITSPNIFGETGTTNKTSAWLTNQMVSHALTVINFYIKLCFFTVKKNYGIYSHLLSNLYFKIGSAMPRYISLPAKTWRIFQWNILASWHFSFRPLRTDGDKHKAMKEKIKSELDIIEKNHARVHPLH